MWHQLRALGLPIHCRCVESEGNCDIPEALTIQTVLQVYLGGFDTEDQAALAYDLAAVKCRGHTAITNFPISDYKQELEHHDSVTKEELVQQLRRQGKGSNQNSSKYRGVTKHQKGKWEARIGQVRYHVTSRLRFCVRIGTESSVGWLGAVYSLAPLIRRMLIWASVSFIIRLVAAVRHFNSLVPFGQCNLLLCYHGLVCKIGRVFQVVGRKYKYLGLFLTEKEAAEAYDRAAVTAKGMSAQTNFEITNYMELLSAPPSLLLMPFPTPTHKSESPLLSDR